ncbi:MAG: hypothetical protein ACE5H8_10030 [Alphaproteobacteria bacterium]
MTGWTSRLLVFAAIGASACAAGAAYSSEFAESLGKSPPAHVSGYDETAPSNRFESAVLANPSPESPDLTTFLVYVQKTYLPGERMDVFRLRGTEMAKLLGYAIGEAATHPAPVDVFAPQFRAGLENLIARLGVYGGYPMSDRYPGAANRMWRLVQEGARGFYDEEMRAAYGSVTEDTGPTSVEAWFKDLSRSEKEQFLQRAAMAGLAKNDGAPYAIAEFEALSVFMDAELDREGSSEQARRDYIRDLAAGRLTISSEK